jgi:hypothetical protein
MEQREGSTLTDAFVHYCTAATLAEVTKEMAKPRVAMSARKQIHILRNDLVVRITEYCSLCTRLW